MEIAYLGLFEKVFNWVLSNIFDPIFKWLSNLLTTVFSWVFQELLRPILLPILEEVMRFAFDLWMDIYCTFIYTGFSGILKLIDYMETAFDIFIGLRTVKYFDGENWTDGTLLEVLLQQEVISTIFWALTLGGLAIALMLTIYATAKSSFDLDFENRRPVTKVLSSMMTTFLHFFTIPFFVYFILKLAAVILSGVTYALVGTNPTTLGRIIFTIASLDAAAPLDSEGNRISVPNYNISTSNGDITLGTTSADIYRYPFYSTNAAEPKDYGNIDSVYKIFDLAEFDYLIGFLAAIFVLVVIALCLLTFVQRIFEVIMLYLVSPYFVSMIPLDDGERFGRWREMFLGKVFTGFGSAIGMRLYLLVCPMIMGNTIQFGTYVSPEMDYMMKLFFLIGGAWAVFKAGPMLTTLISFQGGQQESATQAMVGGFVYGHTVGKVMTYGKRAVSSLGSKGGKAGQGSQKPDVSKQQDGKKQQKFDGTTGGAGTASSGKSKSQGTTPAAGSAKTWKAGEKPTGERTAKPLIGANRTPAVATAATGTAASTAATGTAASTATAGTAASAAPASSTAPAASSEPKTGGIRLGSLFQNYRDENGNHKIRVLGMGVTRDAAGNTTSVKMPGMKLKKTSPDGSFKVSKMHLPGIAKIRSNVQNGELKYSDISVLGMKYHNDGSESTYSLGKHLSVSKGKDGSMSHLKIGSFKVHNTEEENGFDLGSKFTVRSTPEGRQIQCGDSISLQTKHGQKGLSSLQLGSLQYSRDGIIKKTKKTSGSGGE